ncbi:odorant receptor 67c-like isoform X2 [Phymastichus coffea]|uniref:odorant receptor 67c-like isoform X2 n=1 Tax=Phymastichus coffea TaxID=108790 RepID=UPI00273B03BA|nr:odorant receptor 67c-like isoform X2 [Phymastichus coffea]
MVHFHNFPWQLAVFLDKCAGYWPFHSWLRKLTLLVFHSLIAISIGLPQVNYWIRYTGDDNLVGLRCSLFFMFITSEFVKLLASTKYQNIRRRIYRRVVKNYCETVDAEEAKILRNSANQAFRLTVTYLVSIVFTAAAFDLSFILKIHHVCALIKIVTLRLEKASQISIELQCENDELARAEVNSLLKDAIKLHVKSFEFISFIEDEYSLCLFFLLLMNAASFGGLIHVIFSNTSDLLESFRYLLVLIVVTLHFYVMFSQGQKIIDCTSEIFDACYNCRWYYMSRKMRTMWLIILMRSSKPCKLTGAKCFILCLETYSKMLKAGVSYYTVFENY